MLLTVFTALGCISLNAAADTTSQTAELRSDNLRVKITPEGKFSIGLSNGFKSDGEEDFIPITEGIERNKYFSVAGIYCDEYIHPFGNGSNQKDIETDLPETENIKQKQTTYYLAEQSVRIVEGDGADSAPAVELKYKVTNTDKREHKIGAKILLDTPYNVPFHMPGHDPIDTQTELSGDDIPSYWYTYDPNEMDKPVVKGTLWNDPSQKPDRVHFATWGHIYYEDLDYNLNYGEKITDNAVCVVWDKQSLAPGETREFVTYLGIGEITQELNPPLAVSVFADSFSNKTSNGFTPVTINLFVKNLNNILIHNPFIKLNVPDGFRADITPQIDYSFPFLNTTTPVEFLWVVCPHDDAKPGINYFEALCGADGIETKSIQFSIELFDSEVDINSFVGLTFSTDYPSVKFMAVDDDTLGVYVDTDSDGTYETIIADSDGTQYGDSNENPELPQEGGEAKPQDGSQSQKAQGKHRRKALQQKRCRRAASRSQAPTMALCHG